MKVIASKTITLKLSEREATILCALIGGVAFDFDTEAGDILNDFFFALSGALPDRKESFTDFFEGEVRIVG